MPDHFTPINIQQQQPMMESPVSIQRQRTVPESQPALAQTVTHAEPETPVVSSSSGPVVSNSQAVLYPCSECSTVLTSVTSLRAHKVAKHRTQTTSPPVSVRGEQTETPVTERREAEVVTLSSDDQDSFLDYSPSKRTKVASPGTEGSGRVTRARTRAMQGIIKPEPGVTAGGSGSSVGSPSSSRGRRAPDIRRTLPVRERSPLPQPMESRESTVEVNRIGSAAEID